MINNIDTTLLRLAIPNPDRFFGRYLVAANNALGRGFLFQTDVKPSIRLVEMAEFVYDVDEASVIKTRLQPSQVEVMLQMVEQLRKQPQVGADFLYENRLMGEVWERFYKKHNENVVLVDIKIQAEELMPNPQSAVTEPETTALASARYLVAAKNRDGFDFLFQTDVHPSRFLLQMAEIVHDVFLGLTLKNRWSHLRPDPLPSKLKQLSVAQLFGECELLDNHLMGEFWEQQYQVDARTREVLELVYKPT